MGIRISNKGLWHGILLSVTVSALPFAAAAQEADDLSQLNTVLDIESLYQPVAALPVHGDTAVELLRELQTKHYSAVEIDDNFSSTVFDSYLDALDSSHLYFLKDDVDQLSDGRTWNLIARCDLHDTRTLRPVESWAPAPLSLWNSKGPTSATVALKCWAARSTYRGPTL